jgi:hypothetical protein
VSSSEAFFLSVYTPTYKRPFLLELCKASVENQSLPTQHVIVPDLEGVGIGGMYARIRDHVDEVHGDYVMVLSDDNILVDGQFAERLWGVAAANEFPDVILFKGQLGPTVQPAAWACEPIETKIDLSCFAVKREVWVENADKWGQRYCGDFDFIHHLWGSHDFCWWDHLAFMAVKISGGEPE